MYMEKGSITIRYLQRYIASKQNQLDDYDQNTAYIKLVEEVGELARAIIHRGGHAAGPDALKGTLEEELCDILYYTLKLANTMGVDLETWVPLKEAYNNSRYPSGIEFDPADESVYR